MNKRISITFLLIALIQGLHSIEEFLGKLWEVYPPATFICGLVSPDLKKGFIIINISLFIILMLVWLTTLGKNYSRGILWLWVILETVNGTGHIIWAIIERSYEPGLITAPILLVLALYLARQLVKPVYKPWE
ncbi:MAG: HXXEE domain-containing protein [Bacteroidota bacterium]